jgi:hypothetical protein
MAMDNDAHQIHTPQDAQGLGDTSTGYIYPYTINSGDMRGTQGVGTKGVHIDSANNRIQIVDKVGNILEIGVQSDETLATTYKDSSGFVISKATAQTHTWFDKTANIGRVLAGTLPDGTYGMWVSQTGVEVTKATPDKLTFNSNQDVFKIIKIDTVTFPALGAASPPGTLYQDFTLDVNTGVSSTNPLIINAYTLVNSSYQQLPIVETIADANAIPTSGGIFYSLKASSYLSDGFIHISIYGINYDISPLPSFPIKYYVLQETAN